MAEYKTVASHLGTAAEALEAQFEEILANYEKRLLVIGSPMVAQAETREQLRAQARSILIEAVRKLRGVEAASGVPGVPRRKDQLFETIGICNARKSIHVSDYLRFLIALSEVALSMVADDLPPSPHSNSVIAAVASAIQTSATEHVARGIDAYTDFLLEKLHEAHVDERRRISRELHDEVAHYITVTFRSLELYELYRAKAPSEAQSKLELAKSTAQEALDITRNLSRELRSFSVTEGLGTALSNLLQTSIPQDIRASASVEGDETLIRSEMGEELFLILREGVRNAVMHSGAKIIKVKVDIADKGVRAAVVDDGRGFKPTEKADHARGTGLASMRERALLLGGHLECSSAPGKGTKVEIYLPLLKE